MKKIITSIIILVSLSVLLFTVFIKAKEDTSDALEIGVNKYLSFLWMVDGAFNNERMEGEFTVNGKTLPQDKKVFICKYKNKNDKECVGNNFEDEFKKLFASTIKYDDVYSDGSIFTWYIVKDNKYVFNNNDNCSINRMSLNHSIKVIEENDNKIIYEIKFKDEHNLNVIKNMILVKEDNDWKISKAYYHDLCEINYDIE